MSADQDFRFQLVYLANIFCHLSVKLQGCEVNWLILFSQVTSSTDLDKTTTVDSAPWEKNLLGFQQLSEKVKSVAGGKISPLLQQIIIQHLKDLQHSWLLFCRALEETRGSEIRFDSVLARCPTRIPRRNVYLSCVKAVVQWKFSWRLHLEELWTEHFT